MINFSLLRRSLMLATVAALCAAHTVNAQTSAANKSLKVLFIGNSYTYFNNLPATLAKLAAGARPAITIETDHVLVGGATLHQHWRAGKALEAIRKGDWDFVVLQDQSLLGNVGKEHPEWVNGPEQFWEFARLFNAEIRKTKARTVFYMTWAREFHPEGQARLNEAYRMAAKEMTALLVPVGLAFQSARVLKPGIQLYSPDHSHPSAAGTYLAACVFYAVLTGQDPDKLPYQVVEDKSMPMKPAEFITLGAEEAEFLQDIAKRTVKAEPSTDKSFLHP